MRIIITLIIVGIATWLALVTSQPVVIADPMILVPKFGVRTVPASFKDRKEIPDKALAVKPPPAAPVKPQVYTLPADQAKAYIYSHESGNNPASVNSIGCYGLGQDCNGVVRSRCGVNYACQDTYFTDYCMGRYGSWAAAYNFWVSHKWW